MKLHKISIRVSLKAVVAVLSLLMPAQVPAAVRPWNGGGLGNNWTEDLNWFRSFGPDPGDDLTFPAGAARLSNNNNFAAGTDFNAITFSAAGYTIAGNQAGLNAGLNVTHGPGNTVLNLPIGLNANQTFTVSQAGANLFLNGVVSMGFRTLTIEGAGQTLAVGNFTASMGLGRIVKSGTGTLWVLGTPAYGGSTTVNGGIVRVDGDLPNSRVIVNSGGTLRGAGTVAGITANSGGAVSPGFNTTNALNSTGGVILNAGSTLNVRLNGTSEELNYDQIDVIGAVTLGGALNLTAGFVPPVGTVFTIIDNDGSDDITGTFAGLPEGAEVMLNGRPFRISYGARFGGIGGRDNDVTIEAVPRLCVWDGDGGQNKFWSLSENWENDIVPLPGDDVQFANTEAGILTSTNDFPPGRAVGSIIFAGGAVKLEGNPVAVEGSLQNLQPGQLEIIFPITLRGSVQISQAVEMTVSGLITLGATQSFRVEHPDSLLRCSGGVAMAGHNLTVFTVMRTPTLNNADPVAAVLGAVTGPGTLTKNGPGRVSVGNTDAAVPFSINEGNVVSGTLNGSTFLNSGCSLLASAFHNLDIAGGVLELSIFGTDVTGILRFTSGGTLDAPILYNTPANPAIVGFLVPRPGSQIDLTGCTLGLRVGQGAGIFPGQQFKLVAAFFADTVTGTFNGLPQGARLNRDGHSFDISYGPGDVTLTADLPFVWDGGGSGTQWSLGGNWNPDVPALPGAALVFPDGVTQRFAVNDFAPGTIFRSLTFQRNSYVIGGNAFAVKEGITHEVSSGASTIVADLSLIGSDFPVHVTSASELRLGGAVSGNIVKTGTGVLSLSGNDDNFLGGQFLEGQVELEKSGATALVHPLDIGDGTLAPIVRLMADNQIADDAWVSVAANARLDLNGHLERIYTLSGTGSVLLGSGFIPTARLTLGKGDFHGAITGTGGISKAGPGTVLLSGSSSFLGTTLVNDGALYIEGSVSCLTSTVADTATLTVNGILSAAGGLVLQGGTLTGRGTVPAINATGGLLNPGTEPAGFQVMLRSGAVTLNAATTFRSLLTGINPGFENQKLSVTGTVELGESVLELERLPGPLPNTGLTVVIIENDGSDAISGTFASLPQGARFARMGMRWQITYAGGDGNDVAITLLELLPPRINSFAVHPGTGLNAGFDVVDIDAQGIGAVTYDFQASSDLGSWSNLFIARSPSGAFEFSFKHPKATMRTFYRVLQR